MCTRSAVVLSLPHSTVRRDPGPVLVGLAYRLRLLHVVAPWTAEQTMQWNRSIAGNRLIGDAKQKENVYEYIYVTICGTRQWQRHSLNFVATFVWSHQQYFRFVVRVYAHAVFVYTSSCAHVGGGLVVLLPVYMAQRWPGNINVCRLKKLLQRVWILLHSHLYLLWESYYGFELNITSAWRNG